MKQMSMELYPPRLRKGGVRWGVRFTFRTEKKMEDKINVRIKPRKKLTETKRYQIKQELCVERIINKEKKS